MLIANVPIKRIAFLILTGIAYIATSNTTLGQEPLVTLVPDLTGAAPPMGFGNIPFKVINISGQDLEVGSRIELLTVDDKSNKVSLNAFRGALRPTSSDFSTRSLKAGETKIINGRFSVEAFSFMRSKGNDVFGEIEGYVVSTKKKFQSDSIPFIVPESLTHLPWVDLGIKNYFSVAPVPGKITSKDDGTRISIPLEVKNITSNSFILNNVGIFVLDASNYEEKKALLAETFSSEGQVVKPGESVEVSSRSYVMVEALKESGYKSGDKIIAVVAGKNRNSNQVFECVSDPFVISISRNE